MSKKKTHEEYVEELSIKNPTIEVIDKYIDANTKILHHCLIHDVYWNTTPSRALQGAGCEECKKYKFHQTKCKTHQQYISEVAMINSDIEVIEQYIDAITPIRHRCKRHDVTWEVSPDNILHGHGCYKCGNEKIGNKNRKTHQQYVVELKRVNSNVLVVGDYIDANTPILHKCLIDGYLWLVSPANILYGKGCPKCSGTMKKSHDEYVEEVKLINPDIEVIGQYVNAKTPILHRCKRDGHIWCPTPSSILCGFGCPRCNESKGERRIRLWLENHDIIHESQKSFVDCRDCNPLPFDFYLPDYNIAIEYDGKQHYESVDYFGGLNYLKYVQYHDKIKTEYCKNNNIKLLRIPYFKNIEEELNNFLFI